MNTHVPAQGGFKVDIRRGRNDQTVSNQWFNRPDDERYLSLDALHAAVLARRERSSVRTVETRQIQVHAHAQWPDRIALEIPGAHALVEPTHWSFGQLCQAAEAPASYLRGLPAKIAAVNLQYGLLSNRTEQIKTLEHDTGDSVDLRAVTGADYGRIYDVELTEAVRRLAGNGVGDTRWKVPGILDWATMRHNPFVDVTKETTTLYASDRDVFIFLVDDTNPIEAGRLADGSPDLYFRGFYCWNSEVGARTLGIATFFLRGVCQNRNLWGVEQFEEIRIRHSKFAASRFAIEAAPALAAFANASASSFIAGIRAAKAAIVARDDEDRDAFLRKSGFGKHESAKIVETVMREEGHPAASVFDFVQGITAYARTRPNQDARLDLEERAKKMLERAA
jgi:hypothetical protein